MVDSPGSAAADIVAIELEHDLYGLDAIPFAAGDQVIDIGAHVGMFTVYLAKRHPEVQITALEPDPVNFAHFRDNLARNGVYGVRTLQRAVTADGRRFPLWRPPHNSGGAGGYYRDTVGFSPSVAESSTLSELLDELGIERCRLLKVDCEGAEHEILRDDAALSRVEWLSAELHENQMLRDRGWTVEVLRSALARRFSAERMHLSDVEMGA